jgi:phosphopantetheine adenylyltransferase
MPTSERNGPTRRGVYPGTFNPPTTAHLAIAEAARHQRRLDRVDLALSRRPINKEHVEIPSFEDRLAVLEEVCAGTDWLRVVVTDATLIVDIAAGYDVVVMGADKWAQVNDVRYYRDQAAMADALARLPEVAIAPRPPLDIPSGMALTVPDHFGSVSSTAARDGRLDLMLPAARAFDERSGAWSDAERYRRWAAG